MAKGLYILDKDRNPVKASGVLEWSRFFEKIDNRAVCQERVCGLFISTVFLGIDHDFNSESPELFETMIFGSTIFEYYQERCTTWQQAEEMHARACEKVRNTPWLMLKLSQFQAMLKS